MSVPTNTFFPQYGHLMSWTHCARTPVCRHLDMSCFQPFCILANILHWVTANVLHLKCHLMVAIIGFYVTHWTFHEHSTHGVWPHWGSSHLFFQTLTSCPAGPPPSCYVNKHGLCLVSLFEENPWCVFYSIYSLKFGLLTVLDLLHRFQSIGWLVHITGHTSTNNMCTITTT